MTYFHHFFRTIDGVLVAWFAESLSSEISEAEYTEVQSQQMDFPQRPSGVNNNPKISTYKLIFVVIIIFIVLGFVVLSSFLFA